ncbi:histidine kinase [Spirillospora sp. NPDC048819]|uniref:sensor histidine kinase n=1 Tax=Spirillospora sp. NPDC048819 TaxID=3155268 RepID=UPI0033CE4E50
MTVLSHRQRLHAWADAGVAAALVGAGLISAPVQDGFSDADRPVDAVSLICITVAGAATAGRHRWPMPVLVVAAAATATYLMLSYPYGPIMFSLAVAVYGAARRVGAVTALLMSAGVFLVLARHALTHPASLPGFSSLPPLLAWVAIPYAAGAARRVVVTGRVRERAEADRRLVDAERLRVAQEVHDVVGHGLAAIQMQADIALHLRDRDPAQSTRALTAISRASSEALDELRAALASIHPAGDGGSGAAGADAATRAPSPGLALVEDLRDRVEAAGVSVDLAVRGRVRRLPPAVDLAAYRVLQEALTNVVKHSAHPKAEVSIAYGGSSIGVRVANQDLAACAPVAEGLGVTGMRRRVEHLGGRFAAGPDGDGTRFVVRAEIPVEAE